MKIGNIDNSNAHVYTLKRSEAEVRPGNDALKPSAEGISDANRSVSERAIIQAIEKANKAISMTNTEARFSIHEGTHEITVKIIDKEKNEVIREIPPEKILDMVAKMWELAGIFVDEKR